ncbi:hypothetical protein [Streptomyces siamensis]|uniref:Lipoprotein n=1 Tax=Streptomyces siamensis TaxID=1274986 RepID=A0ABP9JIS2_9ACTN
MIKRVYMTAGVVLAAVIALSGCGAEKSGKAKSTPQSAATAKSGGAVGSPSADSGANTGESGGTQPTDRSTPTASPFVTATRPLKDGTAVLTHCADSDDPYTTVEVRNPNARQGVFGVKISYKDAHGFTMSESYDEVTVSAKSKAPVRVAAAGAGPVDAISLCAVNPRATAVR